MMQPYNHMMGELSYCSTGKKVTIRQEEVPAFTAISVTDTLSENTCFIYIANLAI